MDFLDDITLAAAFGNPIEFLFALFISILLGFFLAWTYKKTHRGFSYSQSFSFALLLVTAITTMIIVLIENSIAAAIGIFGAFSIIRFRTAVKDVRDVVFLFLALASGLGIGLGELTISILGTLVLCGLIFLVYKSNFGGLRKLEYVLNFKMDAKNHSNDVFQGVMEKYLKKQLLLNIESKERGKILAFTFNISLKNDDDLNDFIGDMNKIKGVSDIGIVSSKNDLEY
jgi:uncharacterized membrane protein YhiD involved in acid resistance